MGVDPEVKDVIAEFEWTRPRHGGVLQFAAPILGLSVTALEQMFYRAIRQGAHVAFTNSNSRAQ